ncbi:MAG TPA: hypothetical protein VLW50_34465 [Streptosporangiaceae bacterium]|nr:hypothetical protein [Streptosporangiaceae bacterium]
MPETTERKQVPQERAGELAKMARAGIDVSGAADSVNPVEAARCCPCGMCWVPPGTPCVRSPEGDHLGRYVRARRKGLLSDNAMAVVLGDLGVVANWLIVPAAVTS